MNNTSENTQTTSKPSAEEIAVWTALWEFAENQISYCDGTIELKSFLEYGMQEFDLKFKKS